MDNMPEWYKLTRSAFLLLQSVIGVLLVSYPLKKRGWFLFRLLLGTALGFGLMTLAGNHIYLRGYSPLAIATHAAVPLIVYLLLIAIVWFCYNETIWTVLFTAATGYMAQDIAGSVKTLFRQIEWIDTFSRTNGDILVVDLLCYGLVYLRVDQRTGSPRDLPTGFRIPHRGRQRLLRHDLLQPRGYRLGRR